MPRQPHWYMTNLGAAVFPRERFPANFPAFARFKRSLHGISWNVLYSGCHSLVVDLVQSSRIRHAISVEDARSNAIFGLHNLVRAVHGVNDVRDSILDARSYYRPKLEDLRKGESSCPTTSRSCLSPCAQVILAYDCERASCFQQQIRHR